MGTDLEISVKVVTGWKINVSNIKMPKQRSWIDGGRLVSLGEIDRIVCMNSMYDDGYSNIV